jgi:hypothetical protein
VPGRVRRGGVLGDGARTRPSDRPPPDEHECGNRRENRGPTHRASAATSRSLPTKLVSGTGRDTGGRPRSGNGTSSTG